MNLLTFAQEHSASLLIGGGIATVLTGSFLSCKATMKLSPALEEYKETMDQIKNLEKEDENYKEGGHDRKVEGTKSLFTHNSEAVAMGTHSLTILNKKGIRAEVTERYNNCKIEGFYATTGHYVLNCPDNALHFISPTDGSET